ncbi:MAG: aminotransferase class I/II-fold pyridoxal phosphate-dependent enzyme, partial [Planctomycetota bacterium]|nr:aminotransferase class I/II-fold pyridoxal phosphate-dependent enzyme [Planctomycetota bacterium]
MSYFRKNIDAMTAYVPGEQPAPGAKLIKLNTNENPYPPSLKAIRVLRGLTADGLRPYPDPTAGEFRLAVSEVLGVPADWVLPGNGSDDVITMIARACLAPGRKAVYPAPTFEFYPTQGRIEGAELVEVPFDDDFNLPVEQLLAAGGAVTFVASPNSPSGTSAPNEQLEQLAAGLDGVLVIDEAYVDFADNNALELVRRFDNVIVLRTLSKGYSLAGLRLGFGVACPSLLSGFLKTKAIYNVSAPAAAVGAAAMRDQDHKNACVEKIKASRVKLTGELEAMGFR